MCYLYAEKHHDGYFFVPPLAIIYRSARPGFHIRKEELETFQRRGWTIAAVGILAAFVFYGCVATGLLPDIPGVTLGSLAILLCLFSLLILIALRQHKFVKLETSEIEYMEVSRAWVAAYLTGVVLSVFASTFVIVFLTR